MELFLERGDYVPGTAGSLRTCTGAQAVLQRVLFRLSARRGAFAPLPEMGSRLYLVLREKPSARQAAAQRYVIEALAEEDVTVKRVELAERAAGEAEVTVYLDWNGQALTAQTTLRG